MKLRIASDFHLEWYDQYRSPYQDNGRDMHETMFLPRMDGEDEQTLILAGDILGASHIDKKLGHPARPIFDALSDRFKDIVVIAGNHEYYSCYWEKADEQLREFYDQWANIEYLQDSALKIGTTLIYGTTLWTDMANNNPMACLYAKNAMADFDEILKKVGTMTHNIGPQDIVTRHYASLLNLKEFLKLALPEFKKVIVTHHAPSRRSVHERFAVDQLNPAFYTPLDGLIMDNDIELWVHGHMHDSSDYQIEKTRVICNPYGYPSAKNPNYNKYLVYDIS